MDTVNSFLQYLQVEKRYSEHTIVAYKKDLEQYVDQMAMDSLEDLKAATHRTLRSWIMDMNENGLTNKSINRKLSAVRSFYRWMRKEGMVEANPCQKIKGPKVEKRLPNFAKESQLNIPEFKEESDDKSESFESLRDTLIFEMFYQTGIRLSELIGLTENNVSDQQIRVLGKRKKERIIPISELLSSQLEYYRKVKQELGLNSSFFFVLKNDNKLYSKLVYRKIKFYLGRVTDLDIRSPHVLRHTFATHMLNNGAGLETLKELLGHSNLAATQVYTHNSFTQLSNIYSQAHPRGLKTN
jgi:integrase/recombinase XerC